jgi:4a-hydroxytetrahydrobiopterin dehydratase
LEALSFVNDLAEVVENMWHHPDILIEYNKVTLRTTTHDADNQVTELDITLIQEIEQLLD